MEFSVAVDNSTCPIMKKTNGCSIPLDLSFPYKEEFKDVCNMHDVCYVCVSEISENKHLHLHGS